MTSVFFKKLNRLKEKSGASMVEFTIAMFLFVILVVSGFEFFMMGHKYMTVSNFANELARTISIQGGIDVRTPNGFQGAGTIYDNYMTASKIMKSVNSLGDKIGQHPEDISIKVKYQPEGSDSFVEKVISSGSSIEIPYGNRFEVTVGYLFKTELLQKVVDINSSYMIERQKGGISEFEHDYEA